MIGHYKRSKWLAEQEALARRARWIACGHRESDHAGRAGRCQADAHRPHHCGFSEWPHAGLCGCRPEFRAGGRRRRGPSAGRRARARRRALHSGRRESDAEAGAWLARSRFGAAGAAYALAACRWPLAAGYADAAISGLLGREPRIPLEGVRMARHSMFVSAEKRSARIGFCSGTGGCGAGACCALVRGKRLRARAGRAAGIAQAHAA